MTIAERVADADAAFAVERSPAVEAGLGGETLRTGSLYGVPLRYRDGRPAGSASVAFGRTQALGDHELSLLRAYAHQAEQALGRVRRHEEEHDAAVLLQQSLLPDRLPDVSGVDVAAHYRAGALNTRVGGDWYDVVRRPDGVVHLTVGDVAAAGSTRPFRWDSSGTRSVPTRSSTSRRPRSSIASTDTFPWTRWRRWSARRSIR